MLSVIMLNVNMLKVIMTSYGAPCGNFFHRPASLFCFNRKLRPSNVHEFANRMLDSMGSQLLAKAENSLEFRNVVIGLAEEAAERNII